MTTSKSPAAVSGEPQAGTGPAARHREAGRLTGAAARSGPTWVLELPAGLRTLSLNDRHHWAEKNRRASALKKAAWAMAHNARIPRLASAFITVEYQPPDKRHRDHDNVPAASGKHCIDGIVAAGVLADDAPPHVAGLSYRIGEPFPKGRIVLHITGTEAAR